MVQEKMSRTLLYCGYKYHRYVQNNDYETTHMFLILTRDHFASNIKDAIASINDGEDSSVLYIQHGKSYKHLVETLSDYNNA